MGDDIFYPKVPRCLGCQLLAITDGEVICYLTHTAKRTAIECHLISLRDALCGFRWNETVSYLNLLVCTCSTVLTLLVIEVPVIEVPLWA
jgi:hypothetical protein